MRGTCLRLRTLPSIRPCSIRLPPRIPAQAGIAGCKSSSPLRLAPRYLRCNSFSTKLSLHNDKDRDAAAAVVDEAADMESGAAGRALVLLRDVHTHYRSHAVVICECETVCALLYSELTSKSSISA